MLDEVVEKLVDAQFQPRVRVQGRRGGCRTLSMRSSSFRTGSCRS